MTRNDGTEQPARPSGDDRYGSEARIRFPDAPRLELDQALVGVTDLISRVQRSQGRLRALLRANALVTGNLSLPDLLTGVAGAARDLAKADHAVVGIRGPGGRLDQLVHVGSDVSRLGRVDELSLEMFDEHPDSLRVDDLAARRASPGDRAKPAPEGSFLGVPIRVRDEVFGGVFLLSLEAMSFTEEDEELVVALAATAAVAVEHARLFAKSELQRTWLEAAVEVTQLLLTRSDDSLDLVLRHASDAAAADAAVLVIKRPGREWTVEAVTGMSGALLRGSTVGERPAGSGRSAGDERPAGDARSFLSGTPLLFDDVRDEDTLCGAAPKGLGPAMAVPLIGADGKAFGSLCVARKIRRAKYSDDDLTQLNGFANLVGVAMELDRAFDDREKTRTAEDHARIAADLHDHVIQDLFATGMQLQSAAGLLPPGDAQHAVLLAVDTLDETIRTIRSTIFQLRAPRDRPAALHHALLRAVESQHATLGFAPTIKLAGDLSAIDDPDLVHDVVAVVTEALSNTGRHAHAKHVTIEVTMNGSELSVSVCDDGEGMGSRQPVSGLVSLRRRAEARRGLFTIQSNRDGGTRLTWTAQFDRTP